MRKYTVRNFRSNLKEALDAARDGEVTIMRGADCFTLKLSGGQNVDIGSKTVVQRVDPIVCLAGHISSGDGRCMVQGCKYSKYSR